MYLSQTLQKYVGELMENPITCKVFLQKIDVIAAATKRFASSVPVRKIKGA